MYFLQMALRTLLPVMTVLLPEVLFHQTVKERREHSIHSPHCLIGIKNLIAALQRLASSFKEMEVLCSYQEAVCRSCFSPWNH